MSTIETPLKQRMVIVDSLRGFALFGILLLHSLEHFDFYYFPESVFKTIDPYIWDTLFFIFAGKSYALFAMMFGLSFFIQMDSQARKNVNFRWPFLWRLTILFLFGYLHSLIFCGDVLTVLSLLGVSLVFFYPLNTSILVFISIVFLIDIPGIWQFYQSLTIPGYQIPENKMSKLYDELFNVFSSGSFFEVARFNSWKGQLLKWNFMIETGRCLQMIALFIWGLILGRSRFFEHISEKLKETRMIFVCSIIVFGTIYLLRLLLPDIGVNGVSYTLAIANLNAYSNVTFMLMLASGFVLLYHTQKIEPILSKLAPYGRMSLTAYVSMGVILIPFYYGYGLGMYKYFSPTLSFILGLGFFILQLWFCNFWFKHFYYGPLEWLWRCITFRSFETPFRR